MDTLGRQIAGPWEAIASERSWGRYLSDAERGLIERAAGRFDAPGTLLDIGCETGRWSQMLSARGWSVNATEVDADLLAVAAARLPGAACVLVDRERTDLPCRAGQVDLVLCLEVEPVMNASWFPDEVVRVLRPGGLLVGTFWNRRSWRAAAVRSCRVGGWYRHDYGRWRRQMDRRGFAFIEQRGLCWAPFRRGSDSSLVPVATRLEQLAGLGRLVRWSPWVGFVARLSPEAGQ